MKKTLPFVSLRREDLDLPIENKIDLYIYLGTKSYTEYRDNNHCLYNCMPLFYIASYYQIPTREFVDSIKRLISLGLVYAYQDDNLNTVITTRELKDEELPGNRLKITKEKKKKKMDVYDLLSSECSRNDYPETLSDIINETSTYFEGE